MSPLGLLGARHQAPGIPPRATTALVTLFALLTTLRGYGWLTARDDSLSLVVMVGLHNPASRGVAIGLAGLSVLAAYATHRHVLVFVAHWLAALTYLSICVSLARAVGEVGNGWQHVAPMLGGVAWHAFMAWLTGPFPPSPTKEAARAERP